MIFYKDLIKKYLSLFSIILFGIVVAHMIITSISRNYYHYPMSVMLTLSFVSLSVFGCAIAFCIRSAKKTNKLFNILHEECDATRAIEEVLYNLENIKSDKNKVTLNTLLLNCYYRNGDMNSAKELLNNLVVYKMDVSVDAKLLWYHNYVMVAVKTFDYENIKKYQMYLEKMKGIYPRKTALINGYLQSETMFADYMNNDFVKVEKYYIDELNKANTLCEKVVYNSFIAKIKNSTSSNPKNEIEFVLNNGKNLCYVKEVKELKERMK